RRSNSALSKKLSRNGWIVLTRDGAENSINCGRQREPIGSPVTFQSHRKREGGGLGISFSCGFVWFGLCAFIPLVVSAKGVFNGGSDLSGGLQNSRSTPCGQ